MLGQIVQAISSDAPSRAITTYAAQWTQADMAIHAIFDVLAAVSSLAVTVFVYRWRLSKRADRITERGYGYLVALLFGAVAGAYVIGTANLMLSNHPGVGRSIAGAIAGAIIAVEGFKAATGMTGSTGLVFAPGLATSMAIGRLGCFFSGLGDFTYGTPTTLPWAVDFGDGIARHPVQVYEIIAMLAFLAVAFRGLAVRDPFFMANGFYLFIGWYGLQRFMFEFLKPYGTVAGPFNIFHFVCVGLIVYAAAMIAGTGREHGRATA